MTGPGWDWDETLYSGAAHYYAAGRMPYPSTLAEVLREELELDGVGRLLDIGCGPGSLTILLAPLFEEAVGVDADGDMLAEAAHQAALAGARNLSWRQSRAEDLPADLGIFRVVSFAQSFHWMDRPLVARQVRPMIEPGGAWVHVFATTHRGAETDEELPHPQPPWARIDELAVAFLGTARRAGQGLRPAGPAGSEPVTMREAGFSGPVRRTLGDDTVAERSVDDVAAAVFSLSYTAPHLFGDQLPAFTDALRRLLSQSSDRGLFSERRRETEILIWFP